MIKGQVLLSTASFGIAIYPEDGAAKDDLLTSADAAMYVAKKSQTRGSINTGTDTTIPISLPKTVRFHRII